MSTSKISQPEDFSIHVKKIANQFLADENVLSLLPMAVYVCDSSGVITNFNEKAVELWGRRPQKGDSDEKFCGSIRLYQFDGTYLPHQQTPVAECLTDGVDRQDMEVCIERPDTSRIIVSVNISPLKNDDGEIVGVVNCFYDVTSRRLAEIALNEKTKELVDYVDNAAIGLHWVDHTGIIKWANAAEINLLGYSPEEYIGQHISKFHVDQENIGDILSKLSRDEKLSNHPSRLICKDGTIRDVIISSSVYRRENEFVHTRCFTVDITEQKKLLKALSESEAKYRHLVQNLHTPLYTTDIEGRITLYNEAAAQLWGREPEIGKDLWCGSYKILDLDGSVMPLEECPMAICLREKREVIGSEILVVRPDGSIRRVAPHPQPVYDREGMMSGAINMLIDITKIRETEIALKASEHKYKELAASLERKVEEKTRDLRSRSVELMKSEERYHKMIDEVEDYAIILLDPKGNILNWNRGAEKIKGYTESEILGKNFSTFYLKEDLQLEVPLHLLTEAKEKGKSIHEGWRKRKDGSLFWGSTILTSLHNDQGDVIGYSKVTRDLTERKLAHDRMEDYTKELEFQNSELQQFVYAASHDLKEPLRKIHLYSDFIQANINSNLDSKSADYLSRMKSSVSRMSRLIDDLLTYSRFTSIDEGFESVALQEIALDVCQQHAEELHQKNIELVITALPVVQGVAFQLRQVFDNLINNAIKYSRHDTPGRITITAAMVSGTEAKALQAKFSTSYWQITFSDNGVGFDQSYADKIFDLFHRLNNNPHTPGSGVGLAICKKILQNHNGFIRAKSVRNQGASFFVYLPAVAVV